MSSRQLTSPTRGRRLNETTPVRVSPPRPRVGMSSPTRYHGYASAVNNSTVVTSTSATSGNASSASLHPALRAENERQKMELESKKRQITRLEAELAAQSQLHEAQRKNDSSQRADAENIIRARLRESESQVLQLRGRVTDATAEVEDLRSHSSRLESDLHECRLALEIARQQAARGMEAVALNERLNHDKAELEAHLKAALAANITRVMEGKVEALTSALDEQLSKFDQQSSHVTSLLAELEALRRDKTQLADRLVEGERVQGEWIAVTDELRYRLRKQEELLQSVKDNAQRDVASARAMANEKDERVNALTTAIDDLQNEVRSYRRQVNSHEVKLEENNSVMKIAKQEAEGLRRELGEARREAANLTDRLRKAHIEREAIESTLAKERVVAESLSSELRQQKGSNVALDRTLEELREDFHTSQRVLDDERSKFNVEHQKLLAALGTATTGRPTAMLSSTAVAPSHNARGVLSPHRPITL